MLIQNLREYLDNNHVKYVIMSHSPAYSAQEIAAMVHVSGREMAKTVIVDVDGKLAMAVLPASFNINFQRLAGVLGNQNVYLATEEEFVSRFPDCEVGAMPPFGNLYGLDVFVAHSLARDEEIVFNAGTHTDLVRMAYSDFARLVKPKVFSFTTRQDRL